MCYLSFIFRWYCGWTGPPLLCCVLSSSISGYHSEHSFTLGESYRCAKPHHPLCVLWSMLGPDGILNRALERIFQHFVFQEVFPPLLMKGWLLMGVTSLLFFFFQVYYERFQNVQKVWRSSTVNKHMKII